MLPVEFIPSTTAVAGSLTVTAILAVLPLLIFFIMLGGFKIATHWCAFAALASSIVIAIAGFGMPTSLALLSASQGTAFGLLVICYIVVTAVWLYNLTESSGRDKDVRAVFSLVGRGDLRIQALLIGFCFCGLMEGLAGFGAPVAITCAMLLALGLPPLKAALVTMVGNSINVAYGAMAIPMITTARLGGVQPTELLSSTGTRITPMFLVWMPFLLIVMLDGKRGIKQLWPVALVSGIGMAAGHFVTAHFVSFELTAVVASLLSFALSALLLVVWKPQTPEEQQSEVSNEPLGASRVILAMFPYTFVVLVFAVAKLWKWGVDLPEILKATDVKFPWPGLDGQLGTVSGEMSKDTILSVSTLASPGTMLLLTGIVVTLVYSLNNSGGKYPFTFAQGIVALGRTVIGLRMAILTIVLVMALAYTMNFSAQTVTIGQALATTGAAFAFFAPFLGWVGTAVTGSATSAGALFANLHSTAAAQAGLNPQLLLSVNEIGGGIGKIISPQNLAIAATAVRQEGLEPELLRKALPYSLGLVTLLGIITLLASMGILGFVIAL